MWRQKVKNSGRDMFHITMETLVELFPPTHVDNGEEGDIAEPLVEEDVVEVFHAMWSQTYKNYLRRHPNRVKEGPVSSSGVSPPKAYVPFKLRPNRYDPCIITIPNEPHIPGP